MKTFERPVWHAGKGMLFDANNEIVCVVMEDHDVDTIIEALNTFERTPEHLTAPEVTMKDGE